MVVQSKMRLRQGMNRPPPLVKPHHSEDDNNLAISSSDRPSPGKRHLPLLTRRRHDSFRSRLEYDEFAARKSGIWKGESLDEYNDFERWRGGSHEGRRRNERKATRHDPVGLHSPPNEDWCDIHRSDSSYLGGYDFRDDVESIDTFEGKQRRQRRLAKALQGSCSDSIRSSTPSMSVPPFTVECPHDFSIGGSQRSKNSSIGRDGSIATSTIATIDDESTIQNRSMSKKSNLSGLNPQLLHARSIPELPPGYLQRHDGVVISLGSSIASSTKSREQERYADVDEQAEAAAQNVVDDLRALGYKVDDNNGILGSNSDSGIFSKFGGQRSSTPSIEATSVRSHASGTNSLLSHEKTKSHDGTSLGMQYPPAMSGNPPESSGRDFTHRMKVKTNSNELQSNGSRRASAKVNTTIDAQSSGSRRSNNISLLDNRVIATRTSNDRISIDEKPSSVPDINSKQSKDAQSAGSRRSVINRIASLGSNKSSSKNDERQSPVIYPPAIALNEARNVTMESCGTEENTNTKDSTIMADGSTLTSRTDDPAMNPQSTSIIFDLPTSQFATSSHAGSFAEKGTPPPKNLNFPGQYPEVTSDGDRVPELVTRVDGITTAMSDLSNQRSAGGSTLSSLTFHHDPPPQPQFATFCEKVLYSCRISAFPST